MSRLLRYAFALAITAFFAVMWGLLIRAHLPRASTSLAGIDYSLLLKEGEQRRTTQWVVEFAGTDIGLVTMKAERTMEGLIRVTSEARIRVPRLLAGIFGFSGMLDLDFQALFSPLRGPQSFDVRSEAINSSLVGTVVGDKLLINGQIAGESVSTRMPFDQSKLLGQTLSPLMVLPDLSRSSVGSSWTVDLLDPLTGSLRELTVTVTGSQRVRLAGGEADVLQLSCSMGSRQWTSWVTEEGDILLQGTSFGISLHRADLPESTLAQLRSFEAVPDAD